MAVLNLSRLAAALVLGAVALTGVAAQTRPVEHPVEYGADVVNSDFRSDTLDLSGNVRVSQGPMSIEAQAATAKDFQSDNSRWTFKDGVHIRTAQADLQSNTANASFVNGQIADARVEGSPAQFEQRGANADNQVRGRAGVIEYDFRKGVVRLTDGVWFSNGKDEFRGDVVIYNVRDERVQINPTGQASGRVRGIIRPRERPSGEQRSSTETTPVNPPTTPSESGA
jgi:lipopolysaccharide transport protein LptA